MQVAQSQIRKFDLKHREQQLTQAQAVAMYFLESIRLCTKQSSTLIELLDVWLGQLSLEKFSAVHYEFQPYFDQDIIGSIIRWAVRSSLTGLIVNNNLVDFAFAVMVKATAGRTSYDDNSPKLIEQLQKKGLSLPIVEQTFGREIKLVRRGQVCRVTWYQNRDSSVKNPQKFILQHTDYEDYEPITEFLPLQYNSVTDRLNESQFVEKSWYRQQRYRQKQNLNLNSRAQQPKSFFHKGGKTKAERMSEPVCGGYTTRRRGEPMGRWLR